MGKQERPGRAWLWFSLARIGIFAAVLAILLAVMPVEPWITTIVAALIAFLISFIFLRRPREELAGQLHRMRRGETEPVSDDEAEDAAFDAPDSRR